MVICTAASSVYLGSSSGAPSSTTWSALTSSLPITIPGRVCAICRLPLFLPMGIARCQYAGKKITQRNRRRCLFQLPFKFALVMVRIHCHPRYQASDGYPVACLALPQPALYRVFRRGVPSTHLHNQVCAFERDFHTSFP